MACRVTGRLTDSAGRPVDRVVFVPRRIAGVVDARREIAVRLSDGMLDVPLAPGVYDVHVGRSRYRVEVPDQALVRFDALLAAGV